MTPSGELGRLGEERVKKEEPVEKYPIRMFTAPLLAPAPNLISLNMPQKIVPPSAPIVPPVITLSSLEAPIPKLLIANPSISAPPIQPSPQI